MNNDLVSKAVRLIINGGIVIFPTETVYGIGAGLNNTKALEKIFRIKGRPSDKPLTAHIARFSDVDKLAKNVPNSARVLMKKFWPGPLTIVLRGRHSRKTVGIRMPDHPIALALIRAVGPIAAPSANFHNQKPPRSVKEIDPRLARLVDIVLDGGKCKIGKASTVLDTTTKPWRILRKGPLGDKIQKQICHQRKILRK